MNAELLNQAMNLFDTYDKFSAFIELSNARGEIRNRYFGRLKAEIFSYSLNSPWSVLSDNFEQYRWYLTEFKQESICLVWCSWHFRLWCNQTICDAIKAKELLASPKFEPIKECFDYIDSMSHPNVHHFFEEKHRYEFLDGLSYSAPDAENLERLSWFAGNKTKEMGSLIMKKVNKFRSPEITELLVELNHECLLKK